MATQVLSGQELYDLGKAEVETASGQKITDFSDGSIADILIGLTQVVADEVIDLVLDRYNKTYIDGSSGVDLDKIGQDHWSIERAEAEKSKGVFKFSRPTTGAGNVAIGINHTVSTETLPDGTVLEFKTTEAGTLTGLTLELDGEASIAGAAGNVASDTITKIVDSLSDSSVVVTNEAAFSGGQEAEVDEEYRESIKDQAKIVRGAVRAAIEARARQVEGVANASIHEDYIPVKKWDESLNVPIGDVFRILKTSLFVSDVDGQSNPTMITDTKAAIRDTRAAGVNILVEGGTKIDITGVVLTIDFDSGADPALMADPTPIFQTLSDYVNAFQAGDEFIRLDAIAAIMTVWGPSGSGDLDDIEFIAPLGDIIPDATEVLRLDINEISAV